MRLRNYFIPIMDHRLDVVKSKLYRTRNQRKILIILFYDDGKSFSEEFCKTIQKRDIGELIDDHYFLHPFDIGTDFRKSIIKELKENSIEDNTILDFVRRGKSAAFFFSLKNDKVNLKLLKHVEKTEDLEEILKNLPKEESQLEEAPSVKMESKDIWKDLFEEEPEDSPKLKVIQFQQNMFDSMGDRDYDCYEFFELESLIDKIFFALFGPRMQESYDEKQEEQAVLVYNQILKVNDFSEYENQVIMSIVYNCLVPLGGNGDEYSPYPVFVLKKCSHAENPCRVIVDHTARVYQSWQDYLDENKLPKYLMVYPLNGRYQGEDEVILNIRNSPACDPVNKVVKVTDATSAIAGIGSSGVLLAAAVPAITVAPVAILGAVAVGVGVGIYSIGRSIATLVDRSNHKETLSVKNAQARGAYLNIAAGAAGFAGAGANAAVSAMAARGATVGTAARLTVNSLGVVNVGMGGLAVGNSVFEVMHRWVVEDEKPTTLMMLQLSTSILFFGHAVYNFKSAGTLIEESQSKMLSNYNKSLRSNRHRKMFRKMELETIRQNSGNVQRGRSEIISTIRKIPNKDEVFAYLTRNNKKFNEMGIKFSAAKGEVLLGGKPIDMNVMSGLSTSNVDDFFKKFPSSTSQDGVFKDVEGNYYFRVVTNVVSRKVLPGMLQEQLIILVCQIITYFRKYVNKLMRISSSELANYSLGFIEKCVDALEKAYRADSEHVLRNFFRNLVDLEDVERLKIFTMKVVREISNGLQGNTSSDIIEQLTVHFSTLLIRRELEQEEVERRKIGLEKRRERRWRVRCEKCGGIYSRG